MSNKVTTSIRHMANQVCSAMRFPDRKVVLSYSLLLAIFLSGVVPQGFMRIADVDGMKLVLCTPEGPSEVWLTDDGRMQEKQPANHPEQKVSNCLAITLSLVALQAWLSTLAAPIEFAAFRPDLVDRRRALVSAKAPQQPRAPPIFI